MKKKYFSYTGYNLGSHTYSILTLIWLDNEDSRGPGLLPGRVRCLKNTETINTSRCESGTSNYLHRKTDDGKTPKFASARHGAMLLPHKGGEISTYHALKTLVVQITDTFLGYYDNDFRVELSNISYLQPLPSAVRALPSAQVSRSKWLLLHRESGVLALSTPVSANSGISSPKRQMRLNRPLLKDPRLRERHKYNVACLRYDLFRYFYKEIKFYSNFL